MEEDVDVRHQRPQLSPRLALYCATGMLLLTTVSLYVVTSVWNEDVFVDKGYMISHALAAQPGRGVGTVGYMITIILLTWMHNDLYTFGEHAYECKLKSFENARNSLTFQDNNRRALYAARVAHFGIMGIVGVSHVYHVAHRLFFLVFVVAYAYNMYCVQKMYASKEPTLCDKCRVASMVMLGLSTCGVAVAMYEHWHKHWLSGVVEFVVLLCIVVFYALLSPVFKYIHMHTVVVVNKDEVEKGSDHRESDSGGEYEPEQHAYSSPTPENMQLMQQQRPRPGHEAYFQPFHRRPGQSIHVHIHQGRRREFQL